MSYLLWRLSYGSYTIFFEKYLGFLVFLGFPKDNFWVFLSIPHLVDNYAKIVVGWGQNFMCHRTLPGRLVMIKKQNQLSLKQRSNVKCASKRYKKRPGITRFLRSDPMISTRKQI